LVWARYESSIEGLTQLRQPRNGAVSELFEELSGSGPVVVAGELNDDQAKLIAQIDGVSLPPAPLRVRQPGAVAELAWRRWRAGDVDEAGEIEPVYLSR
jgi:tRNA threonylcarbamoyladenosine biosynthesis protein TsaB